MRRLLVAGIASAGLLSTWSYLTYVRIRTVRLADGIYALLGGGSNSLVVFSGTDLLVVDPKFPPGAQALHGWLEHNVEAVRTTLVNTHYHYDHTYGNKLYGKVPIYARAAVPHLMRSEWNEFNDPAW